MAQVTESLLAEFQCRVDAGQHINSTVHEEAQLLHGFREREVMRLYARALVERAKEAVRAIDRLMAARRALEMRHDLKGDLQMEERAAVNAIEDARYMLLEAVELPNVAVESMRPPKAIPHA